MRVPMIIMENFYIYANNDEQEANNFTINIFQNIKLDKDFEVALKSISYDSAIYTFTNDHVIATKETLVLDGSLPKISDTFSNSHTVDMNPVLSMHAHNKFEKRTIELKNVHYTKPSSIRDYLNELLGEYATFSLQSNNKQLTITMNKKCTIYLANQLNITLGFKNDYFDGDREYNAEFTPQYHRNIKEIYIYTNIVTHSHVNNVQAPLLKIIPFESSDTFSRKYCEIINPYYIKVNRKEISNITFELRSFDGRLFPFLKNTKTMMILHFNPIN